MTDHSNSWNGTIMTFDDFEDFRGHFDLSTAQELYDAFVKIKYVISIKEVFHLRRWFDNLYIHIFLLLEFLCTVPLVT